MENAKNTKKQVILVMFRYNPQLGDYCTLEERDVVKTTKTCITVDCGCGFTKSFDVFGNEKKRSKDVYGSSLYRIYDLEAAKVLFDGEKFNGYRISRGKEIFD